MNLKYIVAKILNVFDWMFVLQWCSIECGIVFLRFCGMFIWLL